MKAEIESLKEHLAYMIVYLERLDREVRAKGLQNEQWFLDWQDELNKISVK